MSGVFGVIAHTKHNALELSTQIAQVMQHRDWYVSDFYEDQLLDVAFGRIGIGIFNKDPQPVWNSDHSIALVMAGEFYNKDIKLEEEKGIRQEHAAIVYYEKYGKDFPRYLDGAFILAILDKNKKLLFLVNDRFGLYPTYYTTQDKPFIFAPEVKGILCDTTLNKTLDLVALAQYMRFQLLLGNRTFFEGIEVFPPASILTYDLNEGNYSISPYWTFNEIPTNPNITFNEAVEETGRLLRAAVERLSEDAYQPGVFLSGGMDSRTIIGLTKRRPMPSFTWGSEHCRDVRYARRIARAVGSDNHWIDMTSGKWVEENADFHLELTEGFHSWIHSHGISALPGVRGVSDVILTGWEGSAVMGKSESMDEYSRHSLDYISLVTYLFDTLCQRLTWPSITEAEESFVYNKEIYQKVRGLALESAQGELIRYKQYREDIHPELMYLFNHARRWTINMITIARSHVEVRFPFFDYDLFDFLFSLPSNMRCRIHFYRAVIQHELPRLALIPYDRDQFLPTSNSILRESHALAVKSIRRTRKYLKLPTNQDTLYADYENYLRSDLKPWGERILFDPAVREHGIFNPVFIESIWKLHQSGRVEWTIGKVAPIMTYEMMLRRFYD